MRGVMGVAGVAAVVRKAALTHICAPGCPSPLATPGTLNQILVLAASLASFWLSPWAPVQTHLGIITTIASYTNIMTDGNFDIESF